ncbi:TPA: tRNA/rRNA methyltransferase [Yersinia enterocolitica]|uniref:Putative methyltransferase n=3 Tax=Yersinia enterocolitica TaxID=630 RepID=A0A0E1NL54_YEREN|nr:tRNA/rRNA methyltransferase [Yersinia enterocolitica]ADZ41504.1 putative methyltransferase [Yersinia enterocolitica subsp. palearctica 105.5R(r)]AJJ29181.1 RNA 2'-O ribose methyltransferase substrate binding family protein [Yersinia enterocolitica]ALG77686.1 methyltransferase [Yersinia enterocolitica]AOF13969.1 tRNA/rRNA methyltransferase [Yersinia enterocolitica]AOF18081.1 tRNA/rRNA methyltransferase [Yersinia enterocolitica]
MNDSFSGKNGKVKVMYVRSDENSSDDRNSNNRGKNPRPAGKGRPGDNAGRGSSPRNNDSRRNDSGRNERVSPGRPARSDNNGPYDSPWKTVSRAPSEEPEFDHGGISGKSHVDPAQLRRQRAEETRVYGENACKALFESRPDAIVRAWFVQSVTPRFREALKWMAANRKAYHVVEEDELAKASGTEHHGGVCFLIKKRQGLDAETYLQQQTQAKDGIVKDCVLALEDVGNPHNLGGIMRTCAHFGINGVLLQDPAMLESGAAVRTAEGGAEHIKAINADDFLSVLDTFRKAGYTIVTTSSHKGVSLAKAELPAKMVLVLGQESDGLTDSAWQQGDMSVSIGGTGKVESLNVSVATGILLSEWWRQNRA